MSKEEIPFKSFLQIFMAPPIRMIMDLTGHDPEDYDGEDADLAFKREKELINYRTKVQYELDTVDHWIDQCKAIQARALENKEETDGNT